MGACKAAVAAPKTAAEEQLVRLSANENPYGPSPAALEAMRDACGRAWRYPEEAADALAASGAEVTRVPLDGAFAHDLEKMVSAPDAGLIYLCNPNNPTASLTPKALRSAFVAAARCPVLADEAYHHYVESPDYESVVPLVKSHPALVVARTFSKVYGLAGARLGYAIAHPALIRKLAAQAAWDSVNVFAVAAGRASLADAAWVEQGRVRA